MARAILTVLGIACGVPTLLSGQEKERPVRVVVTPEHSSVLPGKATVKIALKDIQNHDVNAPKDFTITLTVTEATTTRQSPPRPSPTTQVTIPQGKDSAKIDLTLQTTGIYLIKATHPALRDGADFIQVRAPTSVQRAPAIQRFKQRTSARADRLFASLEWGGLSLKALPDVATPPLDLFVVTTHQGAKVIPEEPVVVRAFLSDEAPQNVAVRFHYSAGRMNPDPLPIPKGSSEGRADLSLDSPGTITLRLVDTQPNNIRLNTDRQWDITFHPVSAELALIANPTAIPLEESAQVRVELRDPKGKP